MVILTLKVSTLNSEHIWAAYGKHMGSIPYIYYGQYPQQHKRDNIFWLLLHGLFFSFAFCFCVHVSFSTSTCQVFLRVFFFFLRRISTLQLNFHHSKFTKKLIKTIWCLTKIDYWKKSNNVSFLCKKKKARINVTLRVNVGFSFIPSFLFPSGWKEKQVYAPL